MHISPTDITLSESLQEGIADPATVAYMAAHSRHLAHECLLRAFEKSGLSKSELARRLGYDPSRLGRILNVPANITVETLGELLFAIDGSSPTYGQSWPLRDPVRNSGDPDWLAPLPKSVVAATRGTGGYASAATKKSGYSPTKTLSSTGSL